MPWTDAATALLKEIYLRGSNAWVAREINRQTGSSFSRNAIIGRAHRIGLARAKKPAPPRLKSTTPPHKRYIFGKNSSPVALEPMQMPEPEFNELETPAEQRCTFAQLTDATCHWIVGDPQEADHFYCGAITDGDKPWCAYHAKKAVDGHATSASSRKRLSRLALWR